MWCTRESVCWSVVHLYGCDCWLLHSMSVCHGEHITIPPGYTQKQSQCPSSWLTKKLTANDSQVRSSTHILLLVEVAALSLKDHQCSTHKVKIWIFFATGCKCFTRLFLRSHRMKANRRQIFTNVKGTVHPIVELFIQLSSSIIFEKMQKTLQKSDITHSHQNNPYG